MRTYLGVDVGTSGSKGVVVSGDGRVLARADRSHGTAFPRPGWVEHDAEKVWWADFTAIVRDLLAAVPDAEPAGLGVSGIGPTLLPADADGRPLRPAILYGVDTRASAEIEELTAELGADEILARAGTALSSQAVGPKWRWLARHEPEVYERTALFLMCSSYLVHRLTGEYVLDHHSASQAGPMYDLATAAWAPDWAATTAPGLELPRLLWPTEVAGRVTAAAAAETGLPEGLPVTAGTVDAWAEATSAGVTSPGDVMVMYGTTMFLIEVLESSHPHPAMWTTRGVVPGTYSLAAGMATSGAVTAWLRDLTGGAPFADLVAEAAAVGPGSGGLLLLPYFAGERTPLFDPDARGVLAGLTTGHTRGEVYRSALEGIAHGVRHNLEVMREAGGDPKRLVAVGGGTQGGLWTRIVTDVTGLAQEIPEHTVGAAFGNAYLAATATGAEPELDRWNPIAERIEPDPAATEIYDRYHPHYRSLYAATRETAHFLAEEQRRAHGA
ncbi:FGGY-family carbohydrate kinase [Pseudonocardia phyllosphaerae]|uniref:FGGY-family carbohydrate kinase n=1 Tax=Pseudonocardia phyllosphaerae TaxID=3390502 RepID=UPI00397ADAD1